MLASFTCKVGAYKYVPIDYLDTAVVYLHHNKMVDHKKYHLVGKYCKHQWY